MTSSSVTSLKTAKNIRWRQTTWLVPVFIICDGKWSEWWWMKRWMNELKESTKLILYSCLSMIQSKKLYHTNIFWSIEKTKTTFKHFKWWRHPAYTLEKNCGSRRIGKLAKIALGRRLAPFTLPWRHPCLFAHFELNTLSSLLMFLFLFSDIVVCYASNTTTVTACWQINW